MTPPRPTSSERKRPYCPECGVSDPKAGCPECGRPCDNEFHGEYREGAEVERLREALEEIAAIPETEYGDGLIEACRIARAALADDEKEES